jgi:non-specific serine/threonine protein kinase
MDDAHADSRTLTSTPAGDGGLVAGRYRVRARLGRGGWKEVYLAYDERLDRDVALAMIVGAGSDQAARARVEREARVTGRLGDHPHVVTVYDAADLDGVPYMVLRAMTGGSLAETPRPTISATLRLAAQIAAALAHAHAHGVIHRDVKPDNVWLAADGSAALGDFGVAVDAGGDRLTADGALVGTARYVSPEQARGDPVSPRSDLYALGVTLYELLTGRPPFSADSFEGLIAQHLTATPLPPSRHEPAIPPALDALVLELLEKDSAARPASADAVAYALGAIAADSFNGPDPLPPLVAGAAVPIATRSDVTNGLPEALTPLLGREQDIEALTAMIERPDVRLLTLTGAGGIGKTRLALALARAARDDFADGVFVCSLAAVSDPDQVLDALVQQIGQGHGLAEVGSLQAAQRLLRRRHVLLVLDNFEHVLRAAVDIATLLATCPGVVAIATSREPLRISPEHVYEVPALSLPVLGEHADAGSLERSAAVALFVDRATARDPSFRVTASNQQAVATICTKLDGLPLAIELAAARTPLLGPNELLRRLEGTLSVLTHGVRDAEPRHRTLRATIDWSHDLLDHEEQAALSALAAFAGGARLHAAEAVTGTTLETIESLVAKNLVVRQHGADGQPRLLLLETIREYARERLDARPDSDAVRLRHCEYFVEWVDRGARELWGPEQLRWFQMFDEETDNLRAAVQWSLSAEQSHLGLRLATAAMEQWGQRRRPSEVADWVATTLAAASGIDDALRGRATMAIALGRDHLATSVPLLREALPLLRAAHDTRWMCWCLQAVKLAELQGITLPEGLADARARALTKEAMDAARQGDDAGALVIALETSICAAESLADVQPLFEEAMSILREMGDRLVTTAVLTNVGCRAMELGEEDFAAGVLDDSIALVRQTGDLRILAYTLANRALLSLLQNETDEAHALIREALKASRDLGLTPPVWEALLGVAVIAAGEGRFERAALFFGASTALRGDQPFSPPEQRLLDRHLNPLRSSGDRDLWTQALNRGAALNYDAAIATALDDPALAV